MGGFFPKLTPCARNSSTNLSLQLSRGGLQSSWIPLVCARQWGSSLGLHPDLVTAALCQAQKSTPRAIETLWWKHSTSLHYHEEFRGRCQYVYQSIIHLLGAPAWLRHVSPVFATKQTITSGLTTCSRQSNLKQLFKGQEVTSLSCSSNHRFQPSPLSWGQQTCSLRVQGSPPKKKSYPSLFQTNFWIHQQVGPAQYSSRHRTAKQGSQSHPFSSSLRSVYTDYE